MSLTAKDYRTIWRQLHVDHDTKGTGARLKEEMGNTTNPDSMRGIVRGGMAAMSSYADWEGALDIAANTLVNLCTAQHEALAEWVAAFDNYMSPIDPSFRETFFGRFDKGRLTGMTSGDVVANHRRDIVGMVKRLISMPDSPTAAAGIGENAVLNAYRNMYSVRTGSYFKSMWSSTDTDSHLAPVWAAIVALQVACQHEEERRAEAIREQERQRVARERRERQEAEEAWLRRKRLFNVLKIDSSEYAYDRNAKERINFTCAALVKDFPVDVTEYDEEEVARLVEISKGNICVDHGYQLSGNKRYVLDKLDEIVALARKKKYPLTAPKFIKTLEQVAVDAYFIGVSGSDDADKKDVSGVELRR
ncbi:hypothetical protein LZ198_37745 [Myxococcus sp. K15C18031901]|uniref:hypothetical protein n=1 Tax=Myxococcus dinghuensis TaxID=2906761 RepID=UPI0020A70838|nr:hypothetical protein [Myxococcus dinghuensis]MCP3104623.1 hypothetical protein [Myxococcus dinghuensis]